MVHFPKNLFKRFKKSTPSNSTHQISAQSSRSNVREISADKAITATGQEDTRRASAEGPSRQSGHNTPNLQSVDRNPQHTPGADQGRGDTHDVDQVRSGKPEGAGLNRVLGRAAAVVNLVKGPAEAFGPLKAILESITTIYDQYKNTVDVEDKIKMLYSRGATLEEIFKKPAGDWEETQRRQELLIKLKKVEERVGSLDKKSAPLRFLDNAQDKDEVNGLLEDLQEAVGDYMMAQQMAIYEQGCRLMGAAQMDVLKRFRSAHGAEFRHGERKGCLKGTRGAVLKKIEQWARDFGGFPVYWLNGLAGTGKSTIAKTIADSFFADGLLGASFFCSRDFQDRRDLQCIFPTLAIQLARRYPEFRSILVPLIESDPEIGYESLYNQMDKLIVQPLSRTSISTVIVIDALDECEDNQSVSAILFVLGTLVSKIPKVKFFLTGRPEPHIANGFRHALLEKMVDKFVLHEVKPDQVNNDIRLFFKTSFSELAGRRRLNNWPTERDLDRLCNQAAGLFVYAAVAIKFVDNNKYDPMQRLSSLLWSGKISGHEEKTLGSLYSTILQGAFGEDAEEDHDKMRSVLSVVVLATNPLSPSAIATLLRLQANDVLLLLLSVNSLLLLHEDPDYPVRPFHKSLADFVTDPNRCTDKRFYISQPDHHFNILQFCLRLMDQSLKKNMCNLPDAVANSDVSDMKEKIDNYITPAVRYAGVSWHMHLINMSKTPADIRTITSSLDQLLREKFLFWLEVVSVLGAVRDAVEAMRVTVDWLEESPTLEIADDCFRFVCAHFEVISASAPHIYHSALILVPKKSIIRKLHESHALPLTKVVHGIPVSWDPVITVIKHPSEVAEAAWSPCDKFIAIVSHSSEEVNILDSATLHRLQTLKFPKDMSMRNSLHAFNFSPDSHILTCHGGGYVTSWDLQTGGIASVIEVEQRFESRCPIIYSANGKVIGVLHRPTLYHIEIFIYDVASGVYMHSHSFGEDVPSLERFVPLKDIWVHGEALRFATVGATAITIWEVGFITGGTPTKVETLPAPKGSDHCIPDQTLLLPDPCRLAVVTVTEQEVLVWDGRKSKYLLRCTDAKFSPKMSFSSDGRFFACSTTESVIYLWRKSNTGYILHEILVCPATASKPLLSPNGKSIVAICGLTTQLWRTRVTTSPSRIQPTQTPHPTGRFVVDFSPDGMLAAAAMWLGKTVTVLNLKSGAPQLTIDAGLDVCGLRLTGKTVVVLGPGPDVVTWILPAGDCVPPTKMKMNQKESAQKIIRGGRYSNLRGVTISSDSRYIALDTGDSQCFYRGTNKESLGVAEISGTRTWFSPDGCDLWVARDSDGAKVVSVSGKGRFEETTLNWTSGEHPPEGCPWMPPRGYKVTREWILGPDGKRLLMFPPLWQSSAAVDRAWKGQFLALLHDGLSEVVILELIV